MLLVVFAPLTEEEAELVVVTKEFKTPKFKTGIQTCFKEEISKLFAAPFGLIIDLL